MPDDAYLNMKRANVLEELHRAGLKNTDVGEILEIGPGTRRRATFKVEKRGGEILFGFHVANAHYIVDMRECLILSPSLFALVPHLRAMMGTLLAEGEKAELTVAETLNGPDVAVAWRRRPNASNLASLANWATRLKLARISFEGETLVELARPEIKLGNAVVTLPPNGFLQATAAGEAALQAKVREYLKGVKNVVDLFSGCGTFALFLARESRVHAVEQDADALKALADGARGSSGLKPVTTERRDLFKQPLTTTELARFDGIVLDPPRAGAARQAREIAVSQVPRVVYVSCNPSTFARDARILVDGGYSLGTVTPMDQFLWSSHIELAAMLVRD